MMAFTGILFWNTGERSFTAILWPGDRPVPAAALVLVGILPLLRPAGLLDTYLAAELYSGRATIGAVYLRAPNIEKLPPEVRPYVQQAAGGYYRLDLVDWAFGELNAPPNPEVRVYRAMVRPFCEQAGSPSDVILEIAEPPGWLGGPPRVSRWDCSQLE